MSTPEGIWDALLERRGPHLVVQLMVPAADHTGPGCSNHGLHGFCWDELTVVEQANFTVLHGYAYGWAIHQHDVAPDIAERWAGWFADMHYDEPVPMAGVIDLHTQFHIWAELSAKLN